MKEYPKIEGIFVREDVKPHKMLRGQYRNPVWSDLEKIKWTFTEKVDGTNIRVYWDGHKVTFGGRTDNAQIPASLYTILAELFDGTANEQVFEQKFGATPVTLYGEGFGAKIQSGGYYSDKQEFILFDVLIDGMWLKRESLEDIAKSFDIKLIPTVYQGTLDKAIEFAEKGFDSAIAKEKRQAEGMVGIPDCGVLDRRGDRVIVKLKTHDLQTQVKEAA